MGTLVNDEPAPYYVARQNGWPGFCAAYVARAEHKSDIAQTLRDWIASGYIIENVSRDVAIAGMQRFSDEQARRALPPPPQGDTLPLFPT